MRKFMNILIGFVILGLVLNLSGVLNVTKAEEKEVEEISEKLIRFHVIANSDSKEDQELKLKVRDKVIEYIYPKLKESKSIEESRQILKENDKAIKEIAIKEIKANKYNYEVATALSYEKFPVKTYGNITLPQGNYEAYRIIIGNGEGQNWWCVMFPPLCFVDITKGEVSYKETEKQMKTVLNDEEYNKVDNKLSNKKINFKFKAVEVLKEIKDKSKK